MSETKFECPEPRCTMMSYGSASGCMVCRNLYPRWKENEDKVKKVDRILNEYNDGKISMDRMVFKITTVIQTVKVTEPL